MVSPERAQQILKVLFFFFLMVDTSFNDGNIIQSNFLRRVTFEALKPILIKEFAKDSCV